MDEPQLLALAPDLDVPALAAAYARDRRVQVRGALTEASARLIQRILAEGTPWGMAWQAGEHGPERIRAEAMAAMSAEERHGRAQATIAVMRGSGHAFAYSSYPLVDAYVEKWAPGGPHDALLDALHGPPVLDLVRAITGVPELIKADAQATLYAPHHFLAAHSDASTGDGRRVGYVLDLCSEDWRPDWGGYLNFYDDDDDVIAGYRPRFNALHLFAVPQRHNVSFVPPFASLARFAITGWFRDR